MQQMSRLGSMRRQLILLCCGSLLLIWSGVFASAWLDRQAEEAVSMKLADLYLEESSSRADAIFRGVHSYLRLAQAAGKLNVPFERLYEGMRAEYGNDSVIAHAVIFDRQDNIHYASSPLPVLPPVPIPPWPWPKAHRSAAADHRRAPCTGRCGCSSPAAAH